MKKVIHHTLGNDKAKKVIDAAVKDYSAKYKQYKPKFKWKNDDTAELSLVAMSQSISATIKIKDGSIEVELTVPALFKMFEAAAMKNIDAEVSVWLEKAKRGEI